VDAERTPQLPECASEGPAMKTPALGVVDAFAPFGPHRSRNFRQAARIARRFAASAVRGDFHLLWSVENAAIFQEGDHPASRYDFRLGRLP